MVAKKKYEITFDQKILLFYKRVLYHWNWRMPFFLLLMSRPSMLLAPHSIHHAYIGIMPPIHEDNTYRLTSFWLEDALFSMRPPCHIYLLVSKSRSYYWRSHMCLCRPWYSLVLSEAIVQSNWPLSRENWHAFCLAEMASRGNICHFFLLQH